MNLQSNYKRRIKVESPGRICVPRGNTQSVEAVLCSWLNSSTDNKNCQSHFCASPRLTKRGIKTGLSVWYSTRYPQMACALEDKQEITYRNQPIAIWTGPVRSLVDAFKASSKTCLINTHKSRASSRIRTSDGGFTGNGLLSKGIL